MTTKHHLALGCILLALSAACSNRGGKDPARDAPTEPTKAQGALTPQATKPASAVGEPVSAAPSAAPAEPTCSTGCTKMSAAEPAPRCCVCAGREGLWTKSKFSATNWLCQR